MLRQFRSVLLAALLASIASAAPPPMPPERLGALLAEVIRDAIPPQYEKKQNWDHTKRITSGLEVHGNLFEPRFERRHKEVRHGQWKHYRIDLVDPPSNLQVRVTNLQSLTAGRAAFTLEVASPISGWRNCATSTAACIWGRSPSKGRPPCGCKSPARWASASRRRPRWDWPLIPSSPALTSTSPSSISTAWANCTATPRTSSAADW